MDIFLDVDDTLSNFRDHAIAMGVSPWTGTWYTQDPATWSQEQKNIQAATNALMMREDFWLNMPLHDGAHELIAAAATRGKVYLLTALPSFAKDDETKDMIRRVKLQFAVEQLNFPAKKVIICQRKDKVNYATSDRTYRGLQRNLLVDDAAQNCDEWSAAGGIAIHHRDCRNTIHLLKDLIDK